MIRPDTATFVGGILLVDKPQGRTSFSVIRALRKLVDIKKIGHAGTLDPFATGVLVILVGQEYTRLSDQLLLQDKEYLAEISLGVSTDTYDCDGRVVARSKKELSLAEVEEALTYFQGEIEQIPPMYSAKKVGGKKLYTLARQGKVVERLPAKVTVETTFLSYHYPLLSVRIRSSKGTYIRSIADELGKRLGCGAHLSQLKRVRSGPFTLDQCLDGTQLYQPDFDIAPYLLTSCQEWLSPLPCSS